MKNLVLPTLRLGRFGNRCTNSMPPGIPATHGITGNIYSYNGIHYQPVSRLDSTSMTLPYELKQVFISSYQRFLPVVYTTVPRLSGRCVRALVVADLACFGYRDAEGILRWSRAFSDPNAGKVTTRMFILAFNQPVWKAEA